MVITTNYYHNVIIDDGITSMVSDNILEHFNPLYNYDINKVMLAIEQELAQFGCIHQWDSNIFYFSNLENLVAFELKWG